MSVLSVYSFFRIYNSKIFFDNLKFIKISMIILFIGSVDEVFSTIYIGYNTDNGNKILCFIKQCYRINENTIIKYYKLVKFI